MTEFTGFDPPTQNWSKLPHQLIELLPVVETLGEMKIILYILRHTWGYHDIEKKITLDEFENGRKQSDGTRIDSGTGLSHPTIVDGIKRAVDHGFISVEIDDSDKGRVKKFYSINQSGVKKLNPTSKDTLDRTEKDTLERNNTPAAQNAASGQGDSGSSTAQDNGHPVTTNTVVTVEGEKVKVSPPQTQAVHAQRKYERHETGYKVGVLEDSDPFADKNSEESKARATPIVPEDKLPAPPLELTKHHITILSQCVAFKKYQTTPAITGMEPAIIDLNVRGLITREIKKNKRIGGDFEVLTLTPKGVEFCEANAKVKAQADAHWERKKANTERAKKTTRVGKKSKRKKEAPTELQPELQSIANALAQARYKVDYRDVLNGARWGIMHTAQKFHDDGLDTSHIELVQRYFESQDWLNCNPDTYYQKVQDAKTWQASNGVSRENEQASILNESDIS